MFFVLVGATLVANICNSRKVTPTAKTGECGPIVRMIQDQVLLLGASASLRLNKNCVAPAPVILVRNAG